MPAAAVASRTPSTAGISGTTLGASGEMFADKAWSLHVFGRDHGIEDVDGRDKPGHDVERALARRLLLRRGCRRRRGVRRGRSLVETLDLGVLAEPGDQFGLRLAH